MISASYRYLERFRLIDKEKSIASIIFIIALYVFLSSPIAYIGDSKYSMLLSENLLKKHSFLLDNYSIPHNDLSRTGDAYVNGDIYQIEVINGQFYYYFPPGTSLLSVPFVALMDLFGVSVVESNGLYNSHNEVRIQRELAALLMAILSVIFYRTARLLLPISWSICITLCGAFGTQIWSTASRAMWTHTWGVLLIGWTVYQILASGSGRRKHNPVLLASVLSWSYFVRPTNSVFILGITVYIVLYYRSLFTRYALTGAFWFACFVAYSWITFGKILPSYYQANRLQFTTFGEAFAGNLISPSRGFFINVPIIFLVAYLLIRYRRQWPLPPLVWLALSVSVLHLLAISSFSPWNGGVCFGARYTTELVPWWTLLAILAVKSMLSQPQDRGAQRVQQVITTQVFGTILLLMSIFINGQGAESRATVRWNDVPKTVNIYPSRVWSYAYPQWLAGIVPMPEPIVFPVLSDGQHVSFADNEGAAYRYDGWSNSEAEFCWTEDRRATIIFNTENPGVNFLRLKIRPFLSKHHLHIQNVYVRVNNQPVVSFALSDPSPNVYVIPLPPHMGSGQKNILTLELPNATSPRSLGVGDDSRRLGVAIYWVEGGSERQMPH